MLGFFLYNGLMFFKLLILILFVSNAYTEIIEIKDTNAINNLGELRKVCGKVRSTHMSSSPSKQVYLNFGRKYPNHVFTGLIWYGSNKGNFTHRPDRFYLNKQICVSGVITQYRGIPQIQIDFEEQIEIQ